MRSGIGMTKLKVKYTRNYLATGMNINSATISVLIGIITLIGGFLAWWLAKVLSERKEDITQTLTLKYLRDDFLKMQEDIKEIKNETKKIPIIEEKLKHLHPK